MAKGIRPGRANRLRWRNWTYRTTMARARRRPMGESDARSPDPGRGRRGRRGGGIDPDGGDRRSGRSPLGTDLVGAQEVPPADPDGSGTASLTLNPGQQSICYELTVQGILLPAT